MAIPATRPAADYACRMNTHSTFLLRSDGKRWLPLVFTAGLAMLAAFPLAAAEPAVTPAPVPAATAPSPAPATTPADNAANPTATTVPAAAGPATINPPAPASAVPSPEPSRWLQSFPLAQRRSIGTGPTLRAVALYPPRRLWRGELLLIPAGGNAVHQQGPLLALADRLAAAGWRCWVSAREPPPEPTSLPGSAPLPSTDELTALLALIAAEPAPADAAPVSAGALPRFLLAQRDAAALAWQLAGGEQAEFAGLVLLAAGPLSDSAPKQPVLDVQLPGQARDVAAAATLRQRHWQHLPQYQQQTLPTSARVPVTDWLGNHIDGWLRKIAATPADDAGQDAEMKQQMTAPPAATAGAKP